MLVAGEDTIILMLLKVFLAVVDNNILLKAIFVRCFSSFFSWLYFQLLFGFILRESLENVSER